MNSIWHFSQFPVLVTVGPVEKDVTLYTNYASFAEDEHEEWVRLLAGQLFSYPAVTGIITAQLPTTEASDIEKLLAELETKHLSAVFYIYTETKDESVAIFMQITESSGTPSRPFMVNFERFPI